MSIDTYEFVATDAPVLESGVYLAQLDRMELRESKTTFTRDDGTVAPSEYYSWRFQLLDGEHDGVFVYANSSTSFGRRAKMRQWVEAILNREIQTGERVTHEALLGVPCQLVLQKSRDADGIWTSTVTAILPAASPAASASTTHGSSNGASAPAPSQPTLEPLFDETAITGTDTDLIRRFEVAKQKLGWKHSAYDLWCKRAMGWTPEAIEAKPGPIALHKMPLEAQRLVVESLEKAAETPEAYDEDGDIRF